MAFPGARFSVVTVFVRETLSLSLYLFNIVADVLQQLIVQSLRDDLLLHSLVDDLPYTIH
jgi:hypothetical protein